MKKIYENAKENPVKVSGGFNAQFTENKITGGIPSKMDPFVYALNANINFRFFDQVDMPLSINYNNKKFAKTYSNPLKEMLAGILATTGISPKYKGVTVHLGERSMSFSPNTYSGVMFYGVGLEVVPKDAVLDFAAFYGRFSKRVLPDTLIREGYTAPKAAYERWGEAIKIGIGRKNHRFELIMFHAADRVGAIDTTSALYNIKPLENLVISMHTKNKITSTVSVDFEYVMSAYTADLRSPKQMSSDDFNYFNNLGDLFTPLMSTRYNKVFSGGVKYAGNPFGAGVNYRRIDPTFVSLGVNSLTTDIEEYTVNGNLILFDSKVNLTGDVGTQHNNLDGNMMQTMQRFIYNLSLAYAISPQLNFSSQYSNFNTNSAPSTINLVDTIKLMQVNQNIAGTLSYTFGNNFKQAVSLSSNYQIAEDIQETPLVRNKKLTNVGTQMANYNVMYVPWKVSVTTSMSYTDMVSDPMHNVNYGPAIAIRREFFERKLSTGITSAWLTGINNNVKTNKTQNMKLSIGFKQGKHHTFKAEASVIDKTEYVTPSKSGKQYQGKFSYAFVF